MFDKYINFNRVAEEIIKNHDDNMQALESLREQYEKLNNENGVSAIQYDSEPVQTSPTADAIINTVMQKEMVKKRMNELESENRLYIKAWRRLSSEEQQVLETFFAKGFRRQDAVDLLCEQFHCEKTKIYEMKTRAVKRFKRLLFG